MVGKVLRPAPAAWLGYGGRRLVQNVAEFHTAVDLLGADTVVSRLPLVVLSSEQARPWSTRCRSCRQRSEQAGSLEEALDAASAHTCPLPAASPAAGVYRQPQAVMP
jgi:hypothetical protein